MAEVFRYEVVPPATWAYLSTILMVSIYFKFNRLISVRNLDILMLAFLAPGLLIVQHSDKGRQKIEPEIRVLAAEVRQLQAEFDALEAESEGSPTIKKVVVEKKPSQPTADPKESPADKNGTTTTTDSKSDDGIVDTAEQSQLTLAKVRLADQTNRLEVIKDNQLWGYVWLFVAAAALLIRMLVDPFMIRRPLLEPNLEFSGLTFLTVVLLFFLIANIIAASVSPEDLTAAESGKNLATAKATDPTRSKGPGYSLLFLFPVVPTFVTEESGLNDNREDRSRDTKLRNSNQPAPEQSSEPNSEPGQQVEGTRGGEAESLPAESPASLPTLAPQSNIDGSLVIVAKIMAIIGQLSIVIGIYLIGFLHFGNTRMGIGIVTLYLLLPYTAEMTGRIIHVLPAAAMVWAVVCYRKPFWSGTFVGLAMGLAYYPIFLLPLWFSFYWHRGLKQFGIGFLVMVGVLAVTLIFTSSDLPHFWQNLRAMFGIWAPLMEGLSGFWEDGFPDESFRIPVMAAFFCLSISFAAWPAQKDLGTLLSCSAALMLAVQFWNGFGGGLLMAWYLPLALMTIFRPNLEDRTAISLSLDK